MDTIEPRPWSSSGFLDRCASRPPCADRVRLRGYISTTFGLELRSWTLRRTQPESGGSLNVHTSKVPC